MEENYDIAELDMGFELKVRQFSPEHFAQAVQERPVSKHSARCAGCPYPSHGFVCWGADGDCMRSRAVKIYNIKEEKQKNETYTV